MDNVPGSAVKPQYGILLREICQQVDIDGPVGLVVAADLPRSATRRAKSHLLNARHPSSNDHVACSQVLRAAIRQKFGIFDNQAFHLNNEVTRLQLLWNFEVKEMLWPGFEETHDRKGAIPWPDFVARWNSGEFKETRDLRIAVDFSGYQSARMGWIIPLKRVSPARKPRFEQLSVVSVAGRPRLALRHEYALRGLHDWPTEKWSLFHDEILGRDPNRRIPVLPAGEQAPSDPELEILKEELFERGRYPQLFICSHEKRTRPAI